MKLKIKNTVLLKKNFKLATIIKKSPVNEWEFVVYYYDSDNNIIFDVITEDDVLPPANYEKIKNRNNRIKRLFRK